MFHGLLCNQAVILQLWQIHDDSQFISAHGDILVWEDTLICNTPHYPMNSSSFVLVRNSICHSVRISAIDRKVVVSDIVVNTESPPVISGGSVVLIAMCVNELDTTSSDHAGIEFSDNINVALVSFEYGLFAVVGGSDFSGVGSKKNGICGLVLIENGSVKATGGTVIGSGDGNHGLSKARTASIKQAPVIHKRLLLHIRLLHFCTTVSALETIEMVIPRRITIISSRLTGHCIRESSYFMTNMRKRAKFCSRSKYRAICRLDQTDEISLVQEPFREIST
jgi:hypothetical protein